MSWKKRHRAPNPLKQFRCKHHIKNRVNGGSNYEDNLLLLWKEKEETFHLMFGSRTLMEAAKLLLRVHRAKRNQRDRRTRVA